MPDDFAPVGFNAWTGTWLWRFRDVYITLWRLNSEEIPIDSIPAQAFDTSQEHARVADMLDSYNYTLTLSREQDAEFGEIARERTASHPLRTHVKIPLLRSLAMWFTPRVELLPNSSPLRPVGSEWEDDRMDFVVTLMAKGGKEKAFAGVLANPPHTTRQIMQPETYLSGEKIEPMRLPAFKLDFKDYVKFDIGAMGEFDVAVLIEQYAGKELSKRLYPDWRGGYYYAARPKNDAAAPLGLLYVSRWSSAERAAEFAGIYARSLGRRYKKAEEVRDPSHASADRSEERRQERKVELLQGRHAWSTEEGAVVIEQQGDTVLVSESLGAATTETLEKEVFGK